MPISVICPGCHARFKVSDQFAGKTGLCPKCKAKITVPNPADVKINEPEEFAAGGRDSKGRPVLKPLPRVDRHVTPLKIGLVALSAVVLLLVTWMLSAALAASVLLLIAGLAVVSPVLAWAGYEFLRNDEFEPYEGMALYARAGVCGGVYAMLWGVFVWFIPPYMLEETWAWMFVAPPFLFVGSLAALACFDLEPGMAFLHYSFYLLVTVLLAWIVGIAPWDRVASLDELPALLVPWPYTGWAACRLAGVQARGRKAGHVEPA